LRAGSFEPEFLSAPLGVLFVLSKTEHPRPLFDSVAFPSIY